MQIVCTAAWRNPQHILLFIWWGLGILIDTVQRTVAILPEKLDAIREIVREWRGRKLCTKRQLQSLLGSLLYLHKCIKPARYFLNRMLGTLRNVVNPARVLLNDDFQRDLAWFDKFLPTYNGISMYVHKKSDSILELDACLTGLGGCWGQYVYHIPIKPWLCKSRYCAPRDDEYCHDTAFVCSFMVWGKSVNKM